MENINGCNMVEPYALRVIGDSMAPEFEEGHIIIVDPGAAVVTGVYVVIDYNGETMLRQFIVRGGKKFLKALNSDFPLLELVNGFTIRGVVIQRAGRRRKDIKHYI